MHPPAQVGTGPHLVLAEFSSGKGSSGRLGGVCPLLLLARILRCSGQQQLYRDEAIDFTALKYLLQLVFIFPRSILTGKRRRIQRSELPVLDE